MPGRRGPVASAAAVRGSADRQAEYVDGGRRGARRSRGAGSFRPPTSLSRDARSTESLMRGARPLLRSAMRSLTLRGRCLLAAGCTAGFAGLILHERDLLRVAALLIAVPLVAV